jgi:carboxypeptidase Taq
MDHLQAYEELLSRSTETAYLVSAISVLNWDQRTHIPPKGHPHRIAQLAELARERHRKITDPRISELLNVVENSVLVKEPLSVEAVNIREWRRTFDRITRIPEALAVEIARATAEGESVWERARPANDWPAFAPFLERIVALKREEAQAIGYEEQPYDALLDGFEPGQTTEPLEAMLRPLCDGLIDLLDIILAAPKKRRSLPRAARFRVPYQQAFAREVAQKLGYDLGAGRMDVSAHPFTTGIGPGDVRITSRYSEDDFNEGFFAVIHEAGHAMYHQGLPLEHWGAPFARPVSLGINESQSRMWENMVARSWGFWQHFYPQAQDRFASLRDVPMDRFFRAVNQVSPGFIRVEADEVTYNLHILMRLELEISLIRKDLSVKELPDAWNEKTQRYLGITPPTHALGVMQDVHWSGGQIGYFPTYSLGNLYAAQFMAQAGRDLGNLSEQFARGEFAPLLGWLREKIHSQGSRYRAHDLVRHVTGEDLDPRYFIAYLNEKYGELYNL